MTYDHYETTVWNMYDLTFHVRMIGSMWFVASEKFDRKQKSVSKYFTFLVQTDSFSHFHNTQSHCLTVDLGWMGSH